MKLALYFENGHLLDVQCWLGHLQLLYFASPPRTKLPHNDLIFFFNQSVHSAGRLTDSEKKKIIFEETYGGRVRQVQVETFVKIWHGTFIPCTVILLPLSNTGQVA